uniref:Uncharacterized protein n=1 Tax=Pipistrellus kuhlii TaxID=59472 RepID=A0A7J7S3V4_PIPKU|nr:hypothetical protein mPipKuh1_010190 [Pipistrellus kuhlii]
MIGEPGLSAEPRIRPTSEAGPGSGSQRRRGANLMGPTGMFPSSCTWDRGLSSPGEKARPSGADPFSRAWRGNCIRPLEGAPGWKELVIRPLGEWKGWSGSRRAQAVSCAGAGLSCRCSSPFTSPSLLKFKKTEYACILYQNLQSFSPAGVALAEHRPVNQEVRAHAQAADSVPSGGRAGGS